jgi:hypothetical protein
MKSVTWIGKSLMHDQKSFKDRADFAVVDGKIYVLGGRLFGNGVPNEINESLTNLDNDNDV